MAGELECSFQHSKTVYFLIRSSTGAIWNGAAFEAYTTANYANYPVAGVEQGVASSYYTGTFPSAIPAGAYNIVAKNQAGGGAAETDATIAVGELQWGTGGAVFSSADVATSGLVSQSSPVKVYRGEQVNNFKFKLVSASDHVTPLTSGVVSGAISRDAGLFGPLQSGIFAEEGYGWYHTTLTSGDMLANTVSLAFWGVGVSGGNSDQRDFSFILQKSAASGAF